MACCHGACGGECCGTVYMNPEKILPALIDVLLLEYLTLAMAVLFGMALE